MDALPTVREELERKTVEYLESQVHRADQSRLEKRDLFVIGKALWNITSGLVGNDVAELCSAVADAGKTPALTRRFVGKGKVILIAWNADGHGFVGQSINADTLQSNTFITSKAQVGEREEELKTLFGALSKSGYMEIK